MRSTMHDPIQFRRFDVRPLLAAGQGLAVVCPFLRAPLIEGLGNDGFHSRVELAGVGGWIVYFGRDDT